jgi:ribosomal protein L32
MPLPSHRHTSSKGRRRRSHNALKVVNITEDKKNKKPHLSHRLAPGTTEYNGHKVYIKGSVNKIEKLLKKQPTADKTDKK